MSTKTEAQAQLRALLGEVEEAKHYHAAFGLLWSLVKDQPMPEEVARDLLEIAGGDLAKVHQALRHIDLLTRQFVKLTMLRAAIQSKQER